LQLRQLVVAERELTLPHLEPAQEAELPSELPYRSDSDDLGAKRAAQEKP
jgi:hypothetical protein